MGNFRVVYEDMPAGEVVCNSCNNYFWFNLRDAHNVYYSRNGRPRVRCPYCKTRGHLPYTTVNWRAP